MLHQIHRRWMDRQRVFLGLQAVASDKAGAFQAASRDPWVHKWSYE